MCVFVSARRTRRLTLVSLFGVLKARRDLFPFCWTPAPRPLRVFFSPAINKIKTLHFILEAARKKWTSKNPDPFLFKLLVLTAFDEGTLRASKA